MFDQKERLTVVKTSIRPGTQGWSGVLPYTTLLRTCGLEVPQNHASIPCFTLFEVRYYLYVSVYTNHSKVATVQLPIHIIHMNSLDVPTNSVAQVAAAIEEKREGRERAQNKGKPTLKSKASQTSFQGRAFAAPRMESLDRARARQAADEASHRRIHATPRDSSSRRPVQRLRTVGSGFSFKTPSSRRKGRVFAAADADEISRRLQRMRKDSFASITTNRSVPRGRHPARKSSALGFYLQETDAKHAGASHAPSVRSSRQPSVDSRRPSSAAGTKDLATKRKGKERVVDW